jgi:hypothetical protein
VIAKRKSDDAEVVDERWLVIPDVAIGEAAFLDALGDVEEQARVAADEELDAVIHPQRAGGEGSERDRDQESLSQPHRRVESRLGKRSSRGRVPTNPWLDGRA